MNATTIKVDQRGLATEVYCGKWHSGAKHLGLIGISPDSGWQCQGCGHIYTREEVLAAGSEPKSDQPIRIPSRHASTKPASSKGQYSPKLHKDGTVTYWSVYRQQWVQSCQLSDLEVATQGEDRERIVKHLAISRE